MYRATGGARIRPSGASLHGRTEQGVAPAHQLASHCILQQLQLRDLGKEELAARLLRPRKGLQDISSRACMRVNADELEDLRSLRQNVHHLHVTAATFDCKYAYMVSITAAICTYGGGRLRPTSRKGHASLEQSTNEKT